MILGNKMKLFWRDLAEELHFGANNRGIFAFKILRGHSEHSELFENSEHSGPSTFLRALWDLGFGSITNF